MPHLFRVSTTHVLLFTIRNPFEYPLPVAMLGQLSKFFRQLFPVIFILSFYRFMLTGTAPDFSADGGTSAMRLKR
jgi:hypothetical protein